MMNDRSDENSLRLTVPSSPLNDFILRSPRQPLSKMNIHCDEQKASSIQEEAKVHLPGLLPSLAK